MCRFLVTAVVSVALVSGANAQTILHISPDNSTSTLTTSRGVYTTERRTDGSGTTYTTTFQPKGYNPMGGGGYKPTGNYKPLGR
jgi:hypothetical protein